MLSLLLCLLFVFQVQSKGLTEDEKEQLFHDVKVLSGPDMAGRKPETEGHRRAQRYLIESYQSIGLKPFGKDYRHDFEFSVNFSKASGVNLLGYLHGKLHQDRFLVFTAHYDHLGRKAGKVHFGADDNASGVAAMLHLARYFKRFPPNHSLIFLATDAEEAGLKGAKAFLQSPPIPIEHIKANINLDMLAQGGRRNTLFVAGTKRNSVFKKLIAEVQRELHLVDFRLKTGHERTARGFYRGNDQRADWHLASDHGPFLKRKIPYLYFGVDEHKYYHSPADTVENIEVTFFYNAVTSINYTVLKLDQLPQW